MFSDLDDPAGTVDHLSFGYDAAGRLIQAQTYGPRLSPVLMSEVSYTYDGRGNLTGETLDPAGSETPYAKSVSYGWDWTTTGPKRDRLNSMTYPTGLRKFNYKYDGQAWTDGIGRMTGLTEGDVTEAPIIDYQMTGGGRNIIQTWGDGKVKLDYNPTVDNPSPSLLDRFGRIKTMDIRKMTGPTESTPIQKYEYGYDANGNRTYARIEQAGHPNDRSYIYEYDNLNRLVDAGWGTINVVNDQATYDPDAVRTTTAWGLDLLGNWSGGVTELRDADGDPGGVVHLRTRSHVVNSANEIIRTTEQIGALAAIEITPFAYDVVGNLIFDGERFYKYDAWNRIAAVYDKGTLVVVGGALTNTPGDLVVQYDYDALGRQGG